MTDLEGVASYFQHWLSWQERERAREGLETTDETAIIKPPSWPSRRQLKAIIGAVQDAQKEIDRLGLANKGGDGMLRDANLVIADLREKGRENIRLGRENAELRARVKALE